MTPHEEALARGQGMVISHESAPRVVARSKPLVEQLNFAYDAIARQPMVAQFRFAYHEHSKSARSIVFMTDRIAFTLPSARQ